MDYRPMNTTERSSKADIITAATEAIDYHADRAALLIEQRNALAILLAFTASALLLF